jgi:hypothetical protein
MAREREIPKGESMQGEYWARAVGRLEIVFAAALTLNNMERVLSFETSSFDAISASEESQIQLGGRW